MTPATGTGPNRVVDWKRITDNRLSVFGSFMVAFCWPGLVTRYTGLSLWVHDIFRRMLQSH
jgi:hypothetical protein